MTRCCNVIKQLTFLAIRPLYELLWINKNKIRQKVSHSNKHKNLFRSCYGSGDIIMTQILF